MQNDRLVRINPFCPCCGRGVFLADHGDWWSCRQCGTRWAKDPFGKSHPPERAPMRALFNPARFIGFPQNRFEVLSDVDKFLALNGVDLRQVIRTLYHATDGDLTFRYDDVDVHLSRSIYWSTDPNAIHLLITLDREEGHDEVSFEYSLEDLRAALLK